MFGHFLAASQCLTKRCQQETTLSHYMAQQFPTHPHTDQPPCLAALCSQAKAIATAAAKWVSGRETKCTRLAPVTVDTFHINLEQRVHFLKEKKNQVLLQGSNRKSYCNDNNRVQQEIIISVRKYSRSSPASYHVCMQTYVINVIKAFAFVSTE